MITSANLYEAGVLAGVVYIKTMPCGSIVLPTGFYDMDDSETAIDVATKKSCTVGALKRHLMRRLTAPVAVTHWEAPRRDPVFAVLKTLPPPLSGCVWGLPIIPR